MSDITFASLSKSMQRALCHVASTNGSWGTNTMVALIDRGLITPRRVDGFHLTDRGRAVLNAVTEVWEVVQTDNSYWHSHGMAGITVHYTEEDAQEHLTRLKATERPGEGSYIRKGTRQPR